MLQLSHVPERLNCNREWSSGESMLKRLGSVEGGGGSAMVLGDHGVPLPGSCIRQSLCLGSVPKRPEPETLVDHVQESLEAQGSSDGSKQPGL